MWNWQKVTFKSLIVRHVLCAGRSAWPLVRFRTQDSDQRQEFGISTPALEALLARAPTEYQYLASVARDGWAWEFLRRNDLYKRDWALRETLAIKPDAATAFPGDAWQLDAYHDPAVGADKALNIWNPQASGFVLPVTAAPPRASRLLKPFVLSEVHCEFAVVDIQPGCQHVVFLDHGQRLQISVSGTSIYEPITLSTMGAVARSGITRRTDLRRALDTLLAEGRLPLHIHRRANGTYRLLSILLALDLTRADVPPRKIAELFFGQQRVESDWNRGARAMQAQIARAVARGRWLSRSGFVTLLR
jgi:hypothetical protein